MPIMKTNEKIAVNLDLTNVALEYDESNLKTKKEVLNEYNNQYHLRQYVPKITSHDRLLDRFGKTGLVVFPLIFVSSVLSPLSPLIKAIVFIISIIMIFVSMPLSLTIKDKLKIWPEIKPQVKQIQKADYIKYFIEQQSQYLDTIKRLNKLTKIPKTDRNQDTIYQIYELQTNRQQQLETLKRDKRLIEDIWETGVLNNCIMVKKLKTKPHDDVNELQSSF